MGEVIAVANQKGGVGKTTSTINLGIGLARKGKKVLHVDADPQYNLTTALGVQEPDEIKDTLSQIMLKIINEEDFDPKCVIMHHEEGVDFIPSNYELAMLEFTMNQVMAKELILKGYIDKVRDDYDYILIDCAPSLQNMTINALTAADYVLIPTSAQFLSTKGLQQLFKTIGIIKKKLNKTLEIAGVLITLYDSRTNIQKEIVAMLREAYDGDVKVFDTTIPVSTKVNESSVEGISIYKFAPNSKVADAYEKFVEEVIANEK